MSRALCLVGALGMLCMASLLFGARPGIGPGDLAALVHPPAADDAAGIVVRELRLPRTLAALLAGAALGMAGTLIQTMTRNPLADPGLLGINAGAAVAIVLTVWIGGSIPAVALAVPAMAGAFAAALLVWAVAQVAGGHMVLILAGAAVTAVLTGILRGIILVDSYALDAFRFWAVGAVDGATFADLRAAALPAVAGLVLAMFVARRLDALGLGDDVAKGLGVGIGAARLTAIAATALLSAASVVVAGPLVFVGLVAPHLARMAGAEGTSSVMWTAALLGAALVLAADIAGRVVLPGLVIEAGLGVTLIGGPFLIWLVRRDLSHAP